MVLSLVYTISKYDELNIHHIYYIIHINNSYQILSANNFSQTISQYVSRQGTFGQSERGRMFRALPARLKEIKTVLIGYHHQYL